MNYIIVDVSRKDLDFVLSLNQKFLPAVGDCDLNAMDHFLRISSYFKIIKVEKKSVGFMIGLLPGKDYGSENYKWFSTRYKSFVYVDRIVIVKENQNKGLGEIFYDDLKDTMKDKASTITCEINTRPYNQQSIDFHRNYGFEQVGMQHTENNKKTVSYMVYNIEK